MSIKNITMNSNQITGLGSGMDTEALVESMLAKTQAKIDAQKAKQQTTLWKRDIYRDVISGFHSVQNNFFNVVKPESNLLFASTYNKAIATSSSKAVSVTANGATNKKTTINSINQLASSTKYTSVKIKPTIKGEYDIKMLSQTLKVKTSQSVTTDGTTTTTSKEIELNIGFDDAGKRVIAQESLDDLKNEGIIAEIGNDGEIIFTRDSGKTTNLSIIETNQMTLDTFKLTAESKIDDKTDTITGVYDPSKIKGQLDISVDGIRKTVTYDLLGSDGKSLSKDVLLQNINADLTHKFGSQAVQLKSDTEKGFTVAIEAGSHVVNIDGDSITQGALGLKSESNQVSLNQTMKDLDPSTIADGKDIPYEMTINGVKIQVSETDSISSLMSKINRSDAGVRMSYTTLSSQFTLERSDSGAGKEITIDDSKNILGKIFSGDKKSTESVADQSTKHVGTDAKLWIDGQKVVRSTNTFTIDGLSFTLNEKSSTPITIDTVRDSESTMKVIKDFVDEYNKLIDSTYGKLNESAEYKEFPPLTEAQRKDMSEKEIELWEEKAKTGLVRNDQNIKSAMTSLRSSFYSSTGITLDSIGITSGSYTTNGKLIVNEAKLKESIETRGDEIAQLFTDEKDGIAVKFNQALDAAASTKISNQGSLVAISGMKNSMVENDSSMGRQLKGIGNKITGLMSTYEKEKVRYWNQMTALEKYMSQMSGQSSWLASQFQ